MADDPKQDGSGTPAAVAPPNGTIAGFGAAMSFFESDGAPTDAVAQARAEVDDAQAGVAQAQQDLEAVQAGHAGDSGSPDAHAAVMDAQADLAGAQADLFDAEQHLAAMRSDPAGADGDGQTLVVEYGEFTVTEIGPSLEDDASARDHDAVPAVSFDAAPDLAPVSLGSESLVPGHVAGADLTPAASAQDDAPQTASAIPPSSDAPAGLSQLDQNVVDDRTETVAQLRADQAEHVASGDYAGAQQDATNIGYALHDIADTGVDVSGDALQADKDQANLGWADYHQKIADENVQDAEWYTSGPEVSADDVAHAQVHLDAAADHAATAADYAAQADAGGVSADHTLSVDTAPAPEPPPEPMVEHTPDPPAPDPTPTD